jgi:nucleoside kinase
MLDLLATGYPSIDHIVPVSHSPVAGETALISELPGAGTFGGCGPNVAVALARLGFRCGLALALGDDEAGREYRAYLEAGGVDTRNVQHLPGCRTSHSYLFRNPDGDYQNFFFPGAADAWRGELALDGSDAVRWGLVTVGYYPYNAQFVQRLSERAIPLAWQLKPDVAAYPRPALEQFVQQSSIIFCNRIEGEYLCDGLGISDLRELLQLGVQIIVLTLGSQGSRILTASDEIDIPAVTRTVIDTTGAGDAFTAGFLAGHFKQYDLATCGRLAAAAASFALERVGCQTNLPDWNTLQARYTEAFGEP